MNVPTYACAVINTMRVAYQDCGCIALPDEVVCALGLTPGKVIDISYDAESGVVTLAAVAPRDVLPVEMLGASCRIGTGSA